MRLEPASLAASLPEQVHVLVEPDPSSAGWLGELRITGPSALVREVRGARCDDVVAALALITVLRLERPDESVAGSAGSLPGSTSAAKPATPAEAGATARSAAATNAEGSPPRAEAAAEPPTSDERATRDERATPEEGATPDADVEEPTPTPEAAIEEPTPNPEANTDERAPPSAAAEELADGRAAPSASAIASADDADESVERARSDDATRAAPLRVESRLFGHLGYSSMPSHAFKAALGAELRLGETVASWSGALSLALARGSDLSPDGTSELTLLTAELRLCPPGVSLDAGLSLRGCAQLSAGRLDLSFSPSRLLETFDRKRPWGALGPSVDAGLPLSSRWTLRATSALMLHLIRDTFERAPTADDADPEARVPLYRPEALSLELLLGVSYTF